MQILWLASWYPNPYEPTNGDFVERHAIAVSKIIPLDLIHVVQTGKNKRTKDGYVHAKEGNLRELVYSFPFKKWGRLFGWLDKIRYNLKYIFYYRSVLNKYSRQYGKPDLIHVHVPMKAGIMALEFADYWEVPFIVTEHSSMYDPTATDTFSKRSMFFKNNTKKIFKKAAAVTNVSAAIGKRVDDLFDLKQSSVIHNVVDTSYFFYKPKTENNIFKWLHVSSLFPLKNAEGIIQALKLLTKERQDWELTFAGAADQQLVDSVYESGLSHKVKFVGELSHKDVAKQMQISSAFVLFSKHENFPCVIIEALCCGLPIISSAVGGVPEAVNTSNGLLVESENILALKNAFVKMMDDYQQYDQQQIANDAALRYSEEVIGNQFFDLYRTVLNNKRSSD